MTEKMTIARPYAKAVFEIALKTETIVEWAEALWNLSEISKDEQVNLLLREETISLEDSVALFLAVCKSNLNGPLHRFVLLLAKRKRLKILPEIAYLYKKMQLDAENSLEVQFDSPVPLDKNQQSAYQKQLEKYFGRKVIMTCAVDTNLLGGFLAQAGNFVVDGSVRGSLTNLKTAMGD